MRNKCHQNSGKENSQSLASSSPQLSNLFIVVNTEETVLNACGVGGGVVVVVVYILGRDLVEGPLCSGLSDWSRELARLCLPLWDSWLAALLRPGRM